MKTKYRHATLTRETQVAPKAKATRRQFRLGTYFIGHLQASIASIGHLYREASATFLTILVIAFALALPASLLVMLRNAQSVSHSWTNGAQLSVFLKTGATEEQAQQFIHELKQNKSLQDVRYFSAAQGADELQTHLGLSTILQDLPENPVPALVEVVLTKQQRDEPHIKQWVEQLKMNPLVDNVEVDLTWLKRLQTILFLGQRIALALGFLLALAVILVVGNTIRLVIQSQREEIAIIKLIGGTDSFIKRPFLYMGIYYGLFAGIISLIIVNSLIAYLQTPTRQLSELYGSHFHLLSLSLEQALSLLLVSMTLGWLGAWLAVGRQLKKIEAA